MPEKTIIPLKGGELYRTIHPLSTCCILKGTAFIYLIPIDPSGRCGKRLFLCEAREGFVFPALDYKDYDNQQWNLGVTAQEKCLLEIRDQSRTEECTNTFAAYIHLKNYEMEGFEEGLAELYRLNLLKEEGHIHQTGQEQKQTEERNLQLIYRLFHSHSRSVSEEAVHPIYDAVRYLCQKTNIPIADFERVQAICKTNITIENIARISHFNCRKIVLEENWYRKDCGPVLVLSQDENTVFACIPDKNLHYTAFSPESGETFQITSRNASFFSTSAYMCCRPFAHKKLGMRELLLFGLKSIQKQDIVRLLMMTLFGSLIGLLIPFINQQLYDIYIPLGEPEPFVQLCLLVLAFMLGHAAFSIVKSISSFRITSRITCDVQNAAYDHLFNLPESFFRRYDSGDLAQRVMGIGNFVNSVIRMLLSGWMTLIFCAVYFGKMLSCSTLLSITGSAVLAVYLLFTITLTLKTLRYEKEMLQLHAKASSRMIQFLSGICKIRIAGAENRALYEYLKPSTRMKEIEMRSDRISLLIHTVSIVFDTVLSVIMYTTMVSFEPDLSVGTFVAFLSAFGSFSAAIISLAENITAANYIKPAYERIQDITETLPELDEAKESPGEITGDIEISNLSFRYHENTPDILQNISLHLKPGEYIGIVGPSGCGKSTLLKLLLGFEKPTSGKIYYDSMDLDSMDVRELRKKMGVVLQDGQLISGSIYENITITSPGASYKEVNEVIQAVGLKEDIREMPQHLQTMLSEDFCMISGGQQQRILIARALLHKPSILFLDEATSALDNITQEKICSTLKHLNATKLVIAHRLSTVMHCDRIIVLDQGKIAEEGSFASLMERKGLFWQLASRQML